MLGRCQAVRNGRSRRSNALVLQKVRLQRDDVEPRRKWSEPGVRCEEQASLRTAQRVEERAEASGFAVFLCHTRESTECEKRTLEVLAGRRVDGIIATPVGQESRHFSEILRSIPVVFAARHFPERFSNARGKKGLGETLLEAATYVRPKQPVLVGETWEPVG